MLCDLAELLADRGFDVDVFTDTWPGFAPPTFASDRVVVKVLPAAPGHRLSRASVIGGGARSALWRRLPPEMAQRVRSRASSMRLALANAIVEVQLLGHAVKMWWASRRSSYTCVIGVDPEGLRRAARLTTFVRTSLGYYSLELMLRDELNSREEHALKDVERRLSRRAAFVVIQDPDRASLLSADNQIPLDRFVFVPNAPLGPARRKPDRLWHERFTLPPDARVLLHSGSIGPWTGIGEIVDACADLPDRWVLVVHTRYDPRAAKHDPSGSSEFEAIMRRAKPGKVLFSLKPVPRQLLPRLIDAADAGVAFYVPSAESFYTQKNIEVIGLSSGKVASYLAAALPVIVNAASTLGALVAKERIGVNVDGAHEIPTAVSEIGEQYEEMSRQAQAYFDRELDSHRGLGRIADRISMLMSE